MDRVGVVVVIVVFVAAGPETLAIVLCVFIGGRKGRPCSGGQINELIAGWTRQVSLVTFSFLCFFLLMNISNI